MRQRVIGMLARTAGKDDAKRDQADQRLIEYTLQQHQREIAVHGRAEHGHRSGRGNESAEDAGERRCRELDDAGPNHRRRADLPGPVGIVAFEIHRQHDGERVGNDGGHVVAIDVRGDVASCFAARQAFGQENQARANRSGNRDA